MKQHTTNYSNTFIQVAEDCPAIKGEAPPKKGEQRTIANIQFEMVLKNPYKFTSDEVIFKVFAEKNDVAESDLETARIQFFSKGQPCFRASPLTKRYGWGLHSDQEGKIALVALGTEAYHAFSTDSNLKVLKAMRSSK